MSSAEKASITFKLIGFGFVLGALAGAKDARAAIVGCGIILVGILFEPRP